jgi:hypothetical protein
VRPDTAAPSITVTLDSTFIRSREDGERHLEVRVGNVETQSGGRQVFGAVAKADTDIKVLIGRGRGESARQAPWQLLHKAGPVARALSVDAAVPTGFASMSMGRIKHTQPRKSYVGAAQRLRLSADGGQCGAGGGLPADPGAGQGAGEAHVAGLAGEHQMAIGDGFGQRIARHG